MANGAYVEHDMSNHLHRHFENLQGQVRSISSYYQANKEIRWHIRQLNLLCHEFESCALSFRKLHYALQNGYNTHNYFVFKHIYI